MRVISDVFYGIIDQKKQVLDIYLPDRDEFSVFFYIHGGGLRFCDKKDEIAVFEHLVNRGIAVVSINYRMYPTAKYPEFVEDAAEALAWTFKNLGEYGSVKGIFAGGISAGAYLSMMLCFDKRLMAVHGIDPLEVKGWIHAAGQPTAHFKVLGERGFDERRVIVDETCPLYYIGAQDKYSPMQFVVSDDDMENRMEQLMLTISTLKHFGHGEDVVALKIMHGTHCSYIKETDEGGNVFGQLIAEYIEGFEK